MAAPAAGSPSAAGGSARAPVLVVSDLHGHLGLLRAAVRKGIGVSGREDIDVVLLGDYCDIGPDVQELLDYLSQDGLKRDFPRIRPHFLLGDHDLCCVMSCEPVTFGGAPDDGLMWFREWQRDRFRRGGRGTSRQYGAGEDHQEFIQALPQQHLAFLSNCRWVLRLHGCVFVHHGLQPGDIDHQVEFLEGRRLAGSAKPGEIPAQLDSSAAAVVEHESCVVVCGHCHATAEQQKSAGDPAGPAVADRLLVLNSDTGELSPDGQSMDKPALQCALFCDTRVPWAGMREAPPQLFSVNWADALELPSWEDPPVPLCRAVVSHRADVRLRVDPRPDAGLHSIVKSGEVVSVSDRQDGFSLVHGWAWGQGQRGPKGGWVRDKYISTVTPTGREGWFLHVFGFLEGPYPNTKAALQQILTGEAPNLKLNGWKVGEWKLQTVKELRQDVGRSAAVTPPASDPGVVFTNIVGEAGELHGDGINAGAVFQVASQFNCLEMRNPDRKPEDGITQYCSDVTQGPACATACGAACAYRNYLVPVPGPGGGQVGQTSDRQLDTLRLFARKLSDDPLWFGKNGYIDSSLDKLRHCSSVLQSAGDSPEEEDRLRNTIQVGVHYDAEVTRPGVPRDHEVTQVFCAACPIGYSNIRNSQGAPQRTPWEPLARCVLEAQYEAALWVTLHQAQRRKAQKQMIYLTQVGGGVFDNSTQWIIDAIRRAAQVVSPKARELGVLIDAKIVHFRQLDDRYLQLDERQAFQ